MCGITGWIDWRQDLNQPKNRNILKKMRENLQLRGPDEGGSWIDSNVALAHRRLIVIDPEGGKQPMVEQIGGNKFVISYNGELYNTAELRRDLSKLGYQFRSHSDTEVLLTAYIEWGVDVVEHLNGIYAFAIWDQNKEQLYMARDRIGVKPLFYSQGQQGFYFGSELKALLAHPEIEATVDQSGLAEIFVMGPGRTPGHGVFKGIKELKPGHYLVYNQAGLTINQYWSLQSREHHDSVEETIRTVRELFTDTVQRQLISDKPICTLLSGGLDSSAITAIASDRLKEQYNQQLHSYSIDYKDNQENFESSEFQPSTDQQWIDLMSDYATTNHHNVILPNQKLVNALKEGVYARDLPGMADIDVSLYLFCAEIAKEFTVAVSGECADEIFAGYPWFYREEARQADTFPWTRNLATRIDLLNDDLKNTIRPAQYVDKRYQQALSEVPRLASDNKVNQKMREITYLTLSRWMPILLERKDRMSMYTGLEVRVPFCDHRLVEYVWNIPWEMKNYGGMRKGILREALTGVLPEEVRTRPKNPYPKTFNPQYLAATRNWLREIMNNNNAPLLDFIDRQQLQGIIDQGADFDQPWFGQLMRVPQLFAYLIQVNIWLEEYNVSCM
ncbi:MAG: asparagine synthase (glutamine-hydrolyzing) [Bacillota bacterium]